MYVSRNPSIIGYQAGVTGLTCGGDSGSPLVFFDSQKEHYVQVGVVSGGTCQSLSDPSIFARVEDYDTLEFITKQFWDNIPPTCSKAIEKLMIENDRLEEEISNMKDNFNKELDRKNSEIKSLKVNVETNRDAITNLKATFDLLKRTQFDQMVYQDFVFSAFTVTNEDIASGNFIPFSKIQSIRLYLFSLLEYKNDFRCKPMFKTVILDHLE